jgi:TetR/AcrR family transcriptional repressor of nem operon
MKRSRSETADTRRRIIAIASELFLKKGIANTGVAEIMAGVGLTPGGFYRHFPSKDNLIAEAHAAANDQLFSFYESAVEGLPPLESMERIVYLYLHQVQRDGLPNLCPLANVGSELHHADERVKAIAMEGYQRLVEVFSKNGEKLGIVDHESLADAIVSTIVGAVTLSRVADDVSTADSILQNAARTVSRLMRAEQTVAD